MNITRDADVVGITDVGAPFHGVIALDLGPVIDNLEYVLRFDQRAVTLIVTEAEPFGEAASISVPYLEFRQAGGVDSVGKIQSREARGFRGVLAVVERQDLYAVTGECKTSVGQQRWTKRIVETSNAVLIAHIGFSGEVQPRKAWAAGDTKSWRRVLVEVCQTVAAEVVDLVGYVVVTADVVLVAIEGLRSAGGKVRVIWRGWKQVGPRQQVQQVCRLGSNARLGNDIEALRIGRCSA